MAGTDSGGDGCDWYIGLENSCGSYDDGGFTASINCCACGGGNRASRDNSSTIDGCTNTNAGKDSGRDDCHWYVSNIDLCGVYDDDDFNAIGQCCACGGG